MFARSAFRACQSAKPQARRYATNPPNGSPPPPHPQPSSSSSNSNSNSNSSSNNTLLYLLGGGGIAAAGYWYLTRKDPGAAQKAEAKIKEALPASVTGPGGVKKALTGGDQGFVSLKLDDVETVTANTKKFRFKLPEDDMVSGLEVASAILTKFKPDGDGKAVIRPYTPVSDEDAKGFMDLLVKKYEGGAMSTHMHDMVPGQRLDVKGPLPKYPWSPNKHEHIALVAGGTGITPMYQLCRAIFKNPDDKTKVTLVFANVSEGDILLKKEFQELENTYPQRFRAFYTLDNPPAEWQGGKGYITKELLKTVLPEPKAGNVKVFVCGPPPFYKAISGPKVSPKDQGELTGILAELGYNKDQVYKF